MIKNGGAVLGQRLRGKKMYFRARYRLRRSIRVPGPGSPRVAGAGSGTVSPLDGKEINGQILVSRGLQLNLAVIVCGHVVFQYRQLVVFSSERDREPSALEMFFLATVKPLTEEAEK